MKPPYKNKKKSQYITVITVILDLDVSTLSKVYFATGSCFVYTLGNVTTNALCKLPTVLGLWCSYSGLTRYSPPEYQD
jgi:hypothetical protein